MRTAVAVNNGKIVVARQGNKPTLASPIPPGISPAAAIFNLLTALQVTDATIICDFVLTQDLGFIRHGNMVNQFMPRDFAAGRLQLASTIQVLQALMEEGWKPQALAGTTVRLDPPYGILSWSTKGLELYEVAIGEERISAEQGEPLPLDTSVVNLNRLALSFGAKDVPQTSGIIDAFISLLENLLLHFTLAGLVLATEADLDVLIGQRRIMQSSYQWLGWLQLPDAALAGALLYEPRCEDEDG